MTSKVFSRQPGRAWSEERKQRLAALYVENVLTLAQIGEEMGVTEDAIKQRIRRLKNERPELFVVPEPAAAAKQAS